MPLRSLLLLIVSAVIAFGIASMVRNRLGATQPAVQRVLVAATDIPQGSFVQASSFTWMEWPQENAGESFLLEGKTDPMKFNGAVARRQILKGEPIVENALVKSNEGGFMSAVLEPGRRAVSIAVDATTGNAGFIFPGDHVDLILTHRIQAPQTGEEAPAQQTLASETFIEDVRVLAVDQTVDNPDNTAILAKTVTLEVTRRQAEKINVAKDLGNISLSLRSLATEPPSSAEGQLPAEGPSYTRDSDVSEILNPDGSTAVKVQVFRGDKHEQMEFSRP